MKILFLAPHLSTGGMPQFLLKRIETLIKNHEIFVVEYDCLSDIFVVQRNQIKQIVGDNNFFTLSDYKLQLVDIIKEKNIDIVHIEHEAEGFDMNLMKILYSDDRKYKIVETCHNVYFNPKNKILIPDAFSFCTPYHFKTFNHIEVYKELIEYPIETIDDSHIVKDFIIDNLNKEELKFDKKFINVLSVGLWNENKNQKLIIDIAKNNPNYHFHIVGNQAPNFSDYWMPLMENLPQNVKVWGERNDIHDFMLISDIFLFPSKVECNPIVLKEAISHNLKIYANNLEQYCSIYDDFINPINEFDNCVSKKHYISETENFTAKQNKFYQKVKKIKTMKQNLKTNVVVNHNFNDGAFVEVLGISENSFIVEFFIDGTVVYSKTIKANSWVKLNRKYYCEYDIVVTEVDYKNHSTKEIFSLKKEKFLENRKVMISFESSSLGDTLAWMPYCDVFQKKHNCILYVSTFKNFLFENQYPNINFINPSTVVFDLYAKYELGWFYNNEKEPILPNTIPLQKTATNILGLEFLELKPKLNFNPIETKLKKPKYVCIAPDSTSGLKEWDEKYWNEIVEELHKLNYQVVNISLNTKYKISGAEIPKDSSLPNIMQIIFYSEFIIGLSSGLSWLSWALNKHVYMIANFTNAEHEFQNNCTKITNGNVCNSCWNNKNFKFDKSDWNWCPIWKGYEKQFECQKSIYPFNILSKIFYNIQKKVHN